MNNLLIRLFVKDYKNITDPEVRLRYGKFAGLTGIVSNLLLFLVKIIVGSLSGSISIVADAVNSLSDSGSSIVALLGFKISGKPADAEHPFGHGRMEYISGLVISFVILMLGVGLIQSAVNKILHPEDTPFGIAAAMVLAASAAVKLWQYLLYRKIGRAIESVTLLSAASDSRNDMAATGSVLLGGIVSRLTGFNLDGYMGIAVAVFIIVSGIRLVAETVSPLLGAAPDKALVQQIHDKVLSYEGIIGLHDLTVHNYGPANRFASLHCEVPAEQDIMVSHDIIDTIENDFLKEMGIHTVIHLDPVITSDQRTNALKERVAALIEQLSPEISMHDFRVVWGITHTNVIFDIAVPFNFHLSDAALIRLISDEISRLNSSYIAKITIDHVNL
jgi:cation diffusion facilitator family transporter